MIVSLAGGVGAARFLEGLIRVIPEKQLTIIGNVGDDTEVYGLHVSPDLDIVAYTLAGVVDPDKGWGFRGDTFQCRSWLERYGYETWFNIGDKDLATHIYRTEKLRKGIPLSEVTQEIVRRLGLKVRLLPPTDDPVQTYVVTENAIMHFQEYMVKMQTKPRVRGVIFRGGRSAKPAKHVLESISKAKGIVIPPSNPIVSIGAILSVPGIRSGLQHANAKIVGLSPIVGGKTIKGPADKLMRALRIQPSAVGVARFYQDFLDALIIDRVDENLASEIKSLGIKVIVADTVMRTMADKVRLARIVVRELRR